VKCFKLPFLHPRIFDDDDDDDPHPDDELGAPHPPASMAIRVSVAVVTTSFLLGILFTHWIADSLTLWKAPVTNEHIWISASYYSLFARSTSELGYALAAVVTLGAATILWSLGDGAAGNIMFDGASIFLYGTAVAVYLYKILPTYDETFSSLEPGANHTGPAPALIRAEVLNLASANLVCSVALTGVMALQAARWWADHSEPEDEVEGLHADAAGQRRKKPRRRKTSKLTTSRLSTAAPPSHSKEPSQPQK